MFTHNLNTSRASDPAFLARSIALGAADADGAQPLTHALGSAAPAPYSASVLAAQQRDHARQGEEAAVATMHAALPDYGGGFLLAALGGLFVANQQGAVDLSSMQ